MKKIYNQPELKIIAIEEQVAIATSTVYNVGFNGEDYNSNVSAEAWEWN